MQYEERMEPEGMMKEYKRTYTEDVRKAVIAFANTNGGEIWIGVDDDGAVIGVPDPGSILLQVTNAIRDSIRPDLTMHTLCEAKQQDGKAIVVIQVQRGTARPYYLAGKGLRPEGVYVRQGASSVPATESAILTMIRDTGGDRFETTRSLLQDLSFDSMKKAFQEEGLRFGREPQRSLGLISQDGSFSNLGLLLSDQCTHTIKAAVFEGNSKVVFRSRMEFSGSLLKQMEDAYLYLDQFNHTKADISGLRRRDMRDYPPEAIREALLNAIVHRDYAFSGSSLISVFDDRIELVSLGGLPKGISFGDLMLGISVLRNSRLADIFYRLNLIEAYGTGLPKIMALYKDHVVQPKIEISDNAFKMTLPNRNADHLAIFSEGENLTYNEMLLLRQLSKDRPVTRKTLEEASGFSQAKTVRVLNALIGKHQVERSGQGKNTLYRLGGVSGPGGHRDDFA